MIEHETQRVIVARATSTLDEVLDQVRAAGTQPVVIALDPVNRATLFATPDHFRALDAARPDDATARDVTIMVDDAHRTALALAFGYAVRPLGAASTPSAPTRPVVTRIGAGTRVFTAPVAAVTVPEKRQVSDVAPALPARRRRAAGAAGIVARVGAVCAALAALLAASIVALALQVHRATIDLYPAEETFTRAMPFAVSVAATSDPNALPTRPFETTMVREMDAPATGKKMIPDETASGPVTLRSRADGALTIRAGTTIRAGNDVSYILQSDVTVPGLDFGRGQLGEATGRVRASVAGPAGNLPAGATAKVTENITYIMGAVTGGTEKQVPVITEEDVTRARAQLENEARERALAEVNAQIPPGVTPLNDFLQREAPVVTVTPPVGTQSERVRVRLAVPVRVPVYDNRAFDALVQARRAGALAEIERIGGGAKVVVAGSVTTRPPTSLGVQGAQVNYEVLVTGTLRTVITPEDATRIGRTVAGTSPAAVARVLSAEPGVGRFQVTDGPSWLPAPLRERTPYQPGNIAVRIVAAAG